MGAHRVPPLCRETQSLGQQMLKAPLGINGLRIHILPMHTTRNNGNEKRLQKCVIATLHHQALRQRRCKDCVYGGFREVCVFSRQYVFVHIIFQAIRVCAYTKRNKFIFFKQYVFVHTMKEISFSISSNTCLCISYTERSKLVSMTNLCW